MRKVAVFILSMILVLPLAAQSNIREKDKKQITRLLEKQVDAWNKGNLEKFMETYWNSEKLVFVGSRGPTYGWQATLDNYKRGYPDKKAMGKLEFKIQDISQIDKKSVFVIGRFELTREIGNVAGYFTLVIQKINGNWLIISDHSSAES